MSIFRYAELRGFWYLGILAGVPPEHSELPAFSTHEYLGYPTMIIDLPYICSTAVVEESIGRNNLPAATINQWIAVRLRYCKYEDIII